MNMLTKKDDFQDMELSISDKKIILTCTHRGGPGKTIENFKEILPNNQIILSRDIHAPIENNDKIHQLIEDIKLNIKYHE
ncbi:MAG: hypothetical protein EOM11_09040 [Erysipelotrichia bacterium]|nr:hypothetical protein [Erysipelotrichia bacterium]